jgi:uncharacterized protein YecT (DUF1311 family)
VIVLSMEQFVVVLFGALLTAVGILANRWLTKARHSETIERRTALLDLLDKMKLKGLTIEQVKTMERQYERGENVRIIEDRMTVESYDYGLAEIDTATCQQDMNIAQRRRLSMLDAKLTGMVGELHCLLNELERTELSKLQLAWEAFRESQSSWVARPWSGGSMAPFIYYGEASRLTVVRLAEIELDVRSARGGLEQAD